MFELGSPEGLLVDFAQITTACALRLGVKKRLLNIVVVTSASPSVVEDSDNNDQSFRNNPSSSISPQIYRL